VKMVLTGGSSWGKPMKHTNGIRGEIQRIVREYRITSDMAWSEVKDEFYTQKEYEAARERIENKAADALVELVVRELGNLEVAIGENIASKGTTGWKKLIDEHVGKVATSWAKKKRQWFKENRPNFEGYYICGICKGWVHESEVEIDHIVNRSLRPDLREVDSNLQPAHPLCNVNKKIIS
jgi:5-methylcytosine-specific restriction endonuclease McrA